MKIYRSRSAGGLSSAGVRQRRGVRVIPCSRSSSTAAAEVASLRSKGPGKL